MKCALIIPAWIPEEIFPTKTAASQINYWEPLGTLYVGAALLQAGHEVKFLNGAFLNHGEILSEVWAYEPEFVGLYATTFGWKKAMGTAEDIKTRLPQAFVTAGGPYPIAMGKSCFNESRGIDAVVTGEAEVTLVEILKRLELGLDLHGLAGVVFRKGSEVINNPPRGLIADLDAIPFPARHLMGEMNHYIPPPATYRRAPVAVMMTSRGCNRKCIFCFQMDKTRESGIRYRSVANVLEEIEHCLGQGYREIKFIDETFAADYDRAMDLVRKIKARRLDFTWFASACVNQVDGPLLQAFKDAGCWAILMGAESGVQKNLNTLRKGIRLDEIRTAVRSAKKAGLKVFTPFLFGIPGETFEEGLQTIEFACELDPHVANFHALTPFPGTELFDNIERYGTLSEDLSDYTYQGAAFTPYSMSREEIGRLRQLAFKRFYSRPRFLLRRLAGMRSLQDWRAAMQGVRSLFWIWAKGDLFRPS